MTKVRRGSYQQRRRWNEKISVLVCGFEGTAFIICNMARWLSWLERRPVTAEVVGSNPIRVVFPKGNNFITWDLSSAGRASALQAEGHRFEPYRSHICRRGGTGRRTGLKILRDLYSHTGSIPVAGITYLGLTYICILSTCSSAG